MKLSAETRQEPFEGTDGPAHRETQERKISAFFFEIVPTKGANQQSTVT